jgi:hypothetical protein
LRRSRLFSTSSFITFTCTLLFLGCTLFLCLDIADLAARVQYIMVDNPEMSIGDKLGRADERLKKLVWTGYMLFVLMASDFHRCCPYASWLTRFFPVRVSGHHHNRAHLETIPG